MFVRLADWCYRKRRLVVVAWIAALVGAFALAGAFGGELKQDYLQPGSESKAAADTLKESFPQKAGDTIQIVVHSDDGVTSPEVQARAEAIFTDVADSDHVVGVASPFADGGAGTDLRGRHDGVRRGRARQDATTTSPPTRPRHWSNPILAAGDDTPAGRGRRAGRGAVPDGSVRHRRHRAPRRGHHPAVHVRVSGGDGAAAASPPCSDSAPRSRSARSCAASSTSRTGRRPPRRWSASGSASTTRC